MLTFTEITETDSTHATLRYAGSSYPSTSYAYYPANTTTAGDAFFGNIRNTVPVKAGYEFDTIMHEIGHGPRLKHGQETNVFGALPAAHDSTEYSIMDYHSYIGADLFYRNVQGSGNQTYMVDDISSLQHVYGANFNTNAGNTVYTWSPTTGEMFINGVGQAASSTNTIYEAIWDGNGNDTYDLSNYTTGVLINLQPGEWSKFSTAQLAYLDSSDLNIRAPGNIDNANLYHHDPRSLIENATGGSAHDTFIGNSAANTIDGGGGADTMRGGAGNDTYVIDNAGDVVDESVVGCTGTDLIRSTVSFNLLDVVHAKGAIENLTLIGGAAINATGNALANVLTGNAAANTSRCAGRRQRLIGGVGNDTVRCSVTRASRAATAPT